jgi:spore maturation protein CgeB
LKEVNEQRIPIRIRSDDVLNSLSILYLGRDTGTSRHRALALARLGHSVCVVDPHQFLPRTPFTGIWTWHTGGLFLEGRIGRQVLAGLPNQNFDLVFVDSGELIGPSLMTELKNRYGTVINYNLDDPFGTRDGKRWRLYLTALKLYDLIVVVRDCNVPEAYAAGASKVLRVDRTADEIAHKPTGISASESEKWKSEVSFIGTWMPERGSFMAKLISLGVPLSIYGDRWQKAPEWQDLRAHWRGPGLYDDSYAKVIQCTKVSLGLLSKGNRDLVTQRSFEIPHLAGVLCAERTSEHLKLYDENSEALFWDGPEECAEKCKQLLRDERLRKAIAAAGRERCLRNRTTNQDVLTLILNEAMALPSARQGSNSVDSNRIKEGREQLAMSASYLRAPVIDS